MAAGGKKSSPTLLLLLLITAAASSSGTFFRQVAGDKHCDKDDKRALVSIREHFNNAYHFASWVDADPCCEWYGVRCDPFSHRVNDLFVINGDTNLTGTIPSAVGDLPYLTVLEFHKLPNLVGGIPESVTRLTRLSLLLLSWNSLSGPIPSFLSKIPSLTLIDLSFNKFSGAIPPSLSSLPNLLAIDFSRNMLDGPIPDSFGSFPESSPPSLRLSHNSLSGGIPASLGKPMWGIVDLSWNRLAGDASFLFGASKPVTQLDLSRNHRLSFDFGKVGLPPNLTLLDLSHNDVYGAVPPEINRLGDLVLLNVSYNRLCGPIPAGPVTAKLDRYAFFHNECLCGSPLQPCRSS